MRVPVVSCLLILLSVMVACEKTDSDSPALTKISPSASIEETQTAVSDPRSAVVQVHADSARGTGVIITDDGHVLTSLGLVRDAVNLSVRFPSGIISSAQLMGKDLGKGLATLLLDVPDGAIVPVSGSPSFPSDMSGTLIGYSNTSDEANTDPAVDAEEIKLRSNNHPSESKGNIVEALGFTRYTPELIQTDLAFDATDQGTPLFTDQGDLLGMVVTGEFVPHSDEAAHIVKVDIDEDWIDRMNRGNIICQNFPKIAEDVNAYKNAEFGWGVDLPTGFSFRNLETEMVHVYNFYDFAPSLTAASYSINAPKPPTGRFELHVSVFVNAPEPKDFTGHLDKYLIETADKLNEGNRHLTFLTDPREVCIGADNEAYEVEVLWNEFAPKLGADYEIGGFDYVSRVRWLAVESEDNVYLLQGVAWPEHFESLDWKIDTILYSFRPTG